MMRKDSEKLILLGLLFWFLLRSRRSVGAFSYDQYSNLAESSSAGVEEYLKMYAAYDNPGGDSEGLGSGKFRTEGRSTSKAMVGRKSGADSIDRTLSVAELEHRRAMDGEKAAKRKVEGNRLNSLYPGLFYDGLLLGSV